MDNNIKRYCQIIGQINELNEELDSERSSFYDGGYSFEKVHEYQLNELKELEAEFKDLFNKINTLTNT